MSITADSLKGERAARQWRSRLTHYVRTGGTVVALLVIVAYFSFASPYFLTTENIFNILLQASNIAIIAAGLTVVLIVAEIDLSIGSVEALAGSVAAVVIISYGAPVFVGIVIGLTTAMVAGAINGLFTWKLRVVSFISTLAMLGIAQGIAFLLTNGQAIAGFPESYRRIGTAEIYGFPGAVIIAIGVYITIHVMLTRTRLGTHMYAVGGNREAAALSGINTGRIKLIALMISGLCAGIGGLILSARLDAGNGLFGAGDLLAAVAAVVIGGTSLFGGQGSVVGTAIGVLIITTIGNGMVLLNVPDFWQQIVVGCIILGSMVIDQVTRSAGAVQ